MKIKRWLSLILLHIIMIRTPVGANNNNDDLTPLGLCPLVEDILEQYVLRSSPLEDFSDPHHLKKLD